MLRTKKSAAEIQCSLRCMCVQPMFYTLQELLSPVAWNPLGLTFFFFASQEMLQIGISYLQVFCTVGICTKCISSIFLCFFLCVEQHQCFCLFLVCHKIFLYSFLCFFLSKYSCLKQLPLPRKLTLLLFDTIHLYVTYFLQLRKNYLLEYPKSLFFLWAG